jgi:exopolyphosphatase/guanosine-5'-triphosphate,3'-diphosphate pyrophosphatase
MEGTTTLRIAAVDIGTNSVRLLVADHRAADLFEGRRLEWKDRRVTVTRLGQGVDGARSLDEAAIGRTIAVLAGYGEAIRAWDVDGAVAVATSAARDAANRNDFLDRAQLALGFRPRVISGEEEAELSFRGATIGISGPPPYLVVDPGGGSTEFVQGVGHPDYSVSIDIGSVRLTERHLPTRPAGPDHMAAARAEVDRLLQDVKLTTAPGTVVGVGGTFTSLGAMSAELPAYDPSVVNGTVLAVETLSGLVARLAIMSIDETAAIPALDPARAGVILGGAIVAERALRRVGGASVVVSESDILDGLAMGAADTTTSR